ncbi:hypothetical protein AVEN_93155-1 [Araneus ventricosus]|uniref:Uncharacterized protein n=1 Tax=Araneus ventricosus TaxID=182803 RepID=A0A4Y2LPD3_ARAVE|nr:hypothetical protein AVEN_93155-1 [Araneus ventricosus]
MELAGSSAFAWARCWVLAPQNRPDIMMVVLQTDQSRRWCMVICLSRISTRSAYSFSVAYHKSPPIIRSTSTYGEPHSQPIISVKHALLKFLPFFAISSSSMAALRCQKHRFSSSRCCHSIRLNNSFQKRFSPPLVLNFSPPSYTKIRCRAKLFLHRSLPEPKVKLFPLAWHRMKIKLIAPRRQTVLRDTPHSPATPLCAPTDL